MVHSTMADQDEIQTLFNAAMRLADQGRLEKALLTYGQVTERAPRLMEAWFNKAIVHERLWQGDEAIQCYLKAVDLAPTNVNASRSIGIHFFHKHQFSRARYWLGAIGDVPRIYGLQNWIYLIHAGHASKSPHRRPWSAAAHHCEGD
ncbi:hypothetical protein D1BOALGB6SA_4870 [Olavius sp. associated proteobacterium Delta 1]|nr:hypothetical protein D1BOALGB6SA_4870 [Olavius sp. associated proteobacterium Delta 1]